MTPSPRLAGQFAHNISVQTENRASLAMFKDAIFYTNICFCLDVQLML
jgi:hypothetical protein